MSEFERGAGTDECLRRAWSALSVGAETRPDCPPPERLWDAVAGKLDGAETGAVIDHIGECAACAEAWRLAREMIRNAATEVSQAPERTSPGKSAWRYPLVAAAAAIALVVGLRFDPGTPEQTVDYRDVAGEELQSLVGEEALPRNAFLLRWTPAADGALYGVRIMTEDLSRIDVAEGLEAEAYRVPPERLAALPEGTRLLWQVSAVLQDARAINSPTFFVEVGPPE